MKDWTTAFPELATLDPADRDALVAGSAVVDAPGGAEIFHPGMAPQNMLLMLDGVVRVQQSSETGREIVLYRVHAGESCVLTTACLLGGDDYAAYGLTETACRAAMIPRGLFDALLSRSAPFRRFVFHAYAVRIASILELVDEVAFRRIDLRLARKLGELADASGLVRLTHQQLATELGTAREVVSRQVQEFQRRGWVAASRGEIRLVDRAALDAFAEQA